MEIHMASSALPVGDLSVRMRNDRHEPNGAKKQRPERIPIDPEHRSYSRNATAAVAIDSLLQNSGRREHDYATRRIRHLGAGLRIAVDTLTFLDFSCHSSVSLQFPARSNKTDTSMGMIAVSPMMATRTAEPRSEERRVGKECRS